MDPIVLRLKPVKGNGFHATRTNAGERGDNRSPRVDIESRSRRLPGSLHKSQRAFALFASEADRRDEDDAVSGNTVSSGLLASNLSTAAHCVSGSEDQNGALARDPAIEKSKSAQMNAIPRCKNPRNGSSCCAFVMPHPRDE